MTKQTKVVDISQPGPSIKRDQLSIDCIMCSLCQLLTKDTLFVENLKQSDEINALPWDRT